MLKWATDLFPPFRQRVVSPPNGNTTRRGNSPLDRLERRLEQALQDSVWSVAFSPDDKRVVSGLNDRTIRVLNAETGKLILPPLKGHKGGVLSVAFSPDGKHIVSGSRDMTIRVWNAETGKLVRPPLEGHKHVVWCVAFSPDGKRIRSGSADNTVRVWDVDSGKLVQPPVRQEGLRAFAFSPDNKCIMLGLEDGTIQVRDAETGYLVRQPLKIHRTSIHSLMFSPDGQRVVSAALNEIIVWDAEMERKIIMLPSSYDITVISISLSPNGEHIVAGTTRGIIWVWDAKTGKLVQPPLEGHAIFVQSVAFSSDGKHIVSGARDKTTRMWDTKTGELRQKGHNLWVSSIDSDIPPERQCVPFCKVSELCLDGRIIRPGRHPAAGGGYSDIWIGTLGDTKVAIKVLRMFNSQGLKIHYDKMLKRAWREYLAWSSLNHPNVLKCLGFSYDFTSATGLQLPALISPWMSEGTLLSYITRRPEMDRMFLITEILSALKFLHAHKPPIVHGDIRAGNILISDQGIPCVADFGLSRIMDEGGALTTSSNIAGSLRWMAPELVVGEKKRGRSSDVWAFGMTILEITTGKPPYYDIMADTVVLMNISQGVPPSRPEPTLAPTLSTRLWDVCTLCWTPNPYDRPRMRQIRL